MYVDRIRVATTVAPLAFTAKLLAVGHTGSVVIRWRHASMPAVRLDIAKAILDGVEEPRAPHLDDPLAELLDQPPRR
ncbi:MAG: hypothetical protein JSS20_16640 [Proteobacteria bacterium]|nr:hypothetical protein [Pseudomonadota bacterium]